MPEVLPVADRPIQVTPERSARTVSWLPFLALLGCYLAGHMAVRLAGSTSLEFDEAEQFLLVQSLAPGYNTQPPLMTWCFWAVTQILGESLAALTMLRLGFLGLAYFFLYRSALMLLSDGRRALLAAGALLLIPALGWEAVCDRVHTTKLCALCLATLYTTLQVLHDGRTRWFLLLGVCLGLGMLCKYNYAFFALALFVATLTMPSYRRRLLHWPLLGTIAIALLLCLPHLLWLSSHLEQLLALIRAKGLVGESGPVMARVRGVGTIASNLGQVLGVMLAGLIVCFPQACRPSAWSGGEPRRWLDRFLLVSLLTLVAVVLVEGMAHIRLYWMLPFLIVAPLAFFLRIEQVPLARAQWLGFATLLAVSVVAVVVLRVYQARHHEPRDAVYRELVERLQADHFTGGIVWAHTHQEAGNLRFHFPQARVVCFEYPLVDVPEAAGKMPRLLLWDASYKDGVAPVLRILGRNRGIRLPLDPAAIRYVGAPSATTTGEALRLGYLLLAE